MNFQKPVSIRLFPSKRHKIVKLKIKQTDNVLHEDNYPDINTVYWVGGPFYFYYSWFTIYMAVSGYKGSLM